MIGRSKNVLLICLCLMFLVSCGSDDNQSVTTQQPKDKISIPQLDKIDLSYTKVITLCHEGNRLYFYYDDLTISPSDPSCQITDNTTTTSSSTTTTYNLPG